MTIAQARTVLGLPENFSLDQLKSQYRKKVLIAHPDRNSGDEKKFLLVQQAFEVLTEFKSNGAVYHQANQKKHHNPGGVYEQRRQAEQAYKEKVHYYYQRKRRVRKDDSIVNEFSSNVKYFFLTVSIFIAFFVFLLMSMVFGARGIIFFLILAAVATSRINFKKYKL